jgi:protein phosphatase
MKLLPKSMRKKLGMSRDAVQAQPNQWVPVSEESYSRKLSAPAPWLCGITDIGKRRSSNEDRYFLSADGALWIVADGMGGHAAGEVASALTIDAIVASMGSMGWQAPEMDSSLSDRLLTAFRAAQDLVSERSLNDENCRGMGSTAIAGMIDGEALHICHVGDVRAYHCSDERFTRVTNDHSLVWELVMSGWLTSDEARLHPQRAKITQAIGTLKGIKPEISKVILKPRDRVLLCSDGLWEALTDQDIHTIVRSEGSMRELASVLVDNANAAGGEDNITAVLYEHPAAQAS